MRAQAVGDGVALELTCATNDAPTRTSPDSGAVKLPVFTLALDTAAKDALLVVRLVWVPGAYAEGGHSDCRTRLRAVT